MTADEFSLLQELFVKNLTDHVTHVTGVSASVGWACADHVFRYEPVAYDVLTR